MKKIVAIVVMLAGLPLAQMARAAPSSASDGGSGIAAGIHASTLGPGVEVVGRLWNSGNLRLSANYMKFDVNGTISDVKYDSTLDMKTALALLDLYPFDGNFRLSLGAALNDSDLRMDGTFNSATQKIGDNTYPTAAIGTLNGRVKLPTVAPYAGIGYGNAVADSTSWSFSCDIGVMYIGNSDVSLSATGPISSDPQFQSDLQTERQKVKDSINKFPLYPVISLGVCYQF